MLVILGMLVTAVMHAQVDKIAEPEQKKKHYEKNHIS